MVSDSSNRIALHLLNNWGHVVREEMNTSYLSIIIIIVMFKGDIKSVFFIYSRTTPYVVALVIAKFLHTFGLFITYEQLKVVHVVQFLFITRVWYVIQLFYCIYNLQQCSQFGLNMTLM